MTSKIDEDLLSDSIKYSESIGISKDEFENLAKSCLDGLPIPFTDADLRANIKIKVDELVETRAQQDHKNRFVYGPNSMLRGNSDK